MLMVVFAVPEGVTSRAHKHIPMSRDLGRRFVLA